MLKYSKVRMNLKVLLRLLRVHQWYKNLIIFIGIIFSGNLINLPYIFLTVMGFIVLCLFSSVVYIVNDIVDIEKDRQHPDKRYRPLPSGRISVKSALVFGLILFIIGLFLAYNINILFLMVSLVFVGLGFVYSFLLKNIFIVDSITVGINFILRAILGAIAINVFFSSWLVICTFLLALVLVFGKRNAEFEKLKIDAAKHRKVLGYYTKELTNNLLIISLGSLFVSYMIYAIMQSHEIMAYTIPIVAFILFRFMHVVYSRYESVEKAENILKDWGVLIGVIVWVVSVMVIFYAF